MIAMIVSIDCLIRSIAVADPLDSVWERPEYWWSPAISLSIDAALEASGLDKEDIDLFDFYSYVATILARRTRLTL